MVVMQPSQVWFKSSGMKFVEMKENTPLNNRAPFLLMMGQIAGWAVLCKVVQVTLLLDTVFPSNAFDVFPGIQYICHGLVDDPPNEMMLREAVLTYGSGMQTMQLISGWGE
jgi:hypothetical protein